MSAFDDLIAKLTERNLSTDKVDAILEAGETLANALGGGAEIMEQLNALRTAGIQKKNNKDIKDIDNPKDLNAMFDDYTAKVKKDASVVNHSREAEMAYKMHSLVSIGKMSKEQALEFSEKLKETDCMKYGSLSDKNLFRDSVVATYEYCGYKSEQQKKMDEYTKKMDAELQGKEYVPEKEKDLYERKTNSNDYADMFKKDSKSYEAGRGVFDRYKEVFSNVWNSPEVRKNRKELKDSFNSLGVLDALKNGVSKNPELTMAAGALSVFAGIGTANPALAAAGASILTVEAVKLYNEKIKGKVSRKIEGNDTKETKKMLSGKAGTKGVVMINSISGERNG